MEMEASSHGNGSFESASQLCYQAVQWLWAMERYRSENGYEVALNYASQVQGSPSPCVGVQMGKSGLRELSDLPRTASR